MIICIEWNVQIVIFDFFLLKTLNNFWFDCGMANKMIPRFSLFFFCFFLCASVYFCCLLFMPCHCTWNAVFSFHMDYHRKVHMHCLLMMTMRVKQTDEGRIWLQIEEKRATERASERVRVRLWRERKKNKWKSNNNNGPNRRGIKHF